VKIVIDMNLSPDWEGVFASNYEIVHWSRIGKMNAHDEEILLWAKKNQYVVLTNDLDFGAILAGSHFESPSVFQIRAQVLDPVIIGSEVLECFEAFKNDLIDGALISYTPEKSRVRKLPL
jgi:predicted nuclease of predicted toxin-antitoxin system